MTGGFNHPVDDQAPRTPWIRVAAQGSTPTNCRIVVAVEREAIPELREVLAFDAENIYLRAAADGEEIIVVARYSIA